MAKTTKIVLKNVRASYPHLFTPDQMSGKYSCDFIISKGDPQVATLKAAIAAAAADCKANNPGKVCKADILGDGDIDKSEDANFANCYFIKTKTTLASIKQNVFKRSDMGLVRIEDESEFYGGANCSASLVCTWYEFQGKVGVHFLLNGVCLEEGGEPFGRNASVASDFGDDSDDIR